MYSIVIWASTQDPTTLAILDGPPSQPVQFRTFEDIPTDTVLSISANVNSTFANISWLPPRLANGLIINYPIQASQV